MKSLSIDNFYMTLHLSVTPSHRGADRSFQISIEMISDRPVFIGSCAVIRCFNEKVELSCFLINNLESGKWVQQIYLTTNTITDLKVFLGKFSHQLDRQKGYRYSKVICCTTWQWSEESSVQCRCDLQCRQTDRDL